MYDTVEQCDERLTEISETAEKLGAEVAYALLRLQVEEEFLKKMRKIIHEQEIGSNEINNTPPTIDDSTLNEPNKKLLNIIRENPGLSTPELSERMGINGYKLYNLLAGLRKRRFIGNGGTDRPGGARWFAK